MGGITFTGTDIATVIVALVGSWTTILAPLLARDWIRDKRFQAIREDQGKRYSCRFTEGDQAFSDKFVCHFSDERARHLSEIRDDVREISHNTKNGKAT